MSHFVRSNGKQTVQRAHCAVLDLNPRDAYFYSAVKIFLLVTTRPEAPLLCQVSADILIVLISDRCNALECMGVPQKLLIEQLSSHADQVCKCRIFLRLRMEGESLDPLHAFCLWRSFQPGTRVPKVL